MCQMPLVGHWKRGMESRAKVAAAEMRSHVNLWLAVPPTHWVFCLIASNLNLKACLLLCDFFPLLGPNKRFFSFYYCLFFIFCNGPTPASCHFWMDRRFFSCPDFSVLALSMAVAHLARNQTKHFSLQSCRSNYSWKLISNCGNCLNLTACS